MKPIHEPDPRFLENLEWQLVSGYRRQERFGHHGEDSTKRRNFKMFGIIVCSVLTGVAATTTAGHFEAMSRRDLLLAQAEIRIQLNGSRVQFARQRLAAVRQQIELGLVPVAEGEARAGDLSRLEIEKQRLELDREETGLSSQPPRDELSAPLVEGRDFVTGRLQLERKALAVTESEVQTRLEQVRTRFETGLIKASELESIREELKRVQIVMNGLDRKLELRARFTSGELSAERAGLLDLSAAAEQRLQIAGTVAATLRSQLAELEPRFAAGVISLQEISSIRTELESAEAEERMAGIELQLLQQNLQNE